MHGTEQAVEGNIDELDAFSGALGHLFYNIDFEADELTFGILKLPGHVANVSTYGPVRGPGWQ
ncbi:hypothetical protein D3C75_989720 [compost metagenome]